MSERALFDCPEGLNDYEEELWEHLCKEWDPQQSVGIYSLKTTPLSETAKEAIKGLATAAKIVVSFQVDPQNGQHYVFAVRSIIAPNKQNAS